MRWRVALASIVALASSACGGAAATPAPITLAIPSASTTPSALVMIGGPTSGTARRRQSNDPELQRLWAGVWLDPSTAYKTCMTIEVRGSTPTVISSIEAVGDKEKYNVRAQSWDGVTLTWSHYVPSTEYLVTYVCVSADADTLRCTWSNDHNADGKEELGRVKPGDAVDSHEPD